MLLKTSSSTIVYSSVNYDSLQTERYVNYVLKLCLSCIVQTLWQCQVRIEATVPIFVVYIKKKRGRQVTEKNIY